MREKTVPSRLKESDHKIVKREAEKQEEYEVDIISKAIKGMYEKDSN